MKNRLLTCLLIACLVLPVAGNSQVLISILFGEQLNNGKMEFGLITGANVSTVTNMEDARFLPTFKLGLFLDYNFNDHWFGTFEANVKSTLGYQNFTEAESLFPILDSIIQGSNHESKKTIKTI